MSKVKNIVKFSGVIVFAVMMTLWSPPPVLAAEQSGPAVSADTDRYEYQVGETIQYTVRIHAPEDSGAQSDVSAEETGLGGDLKMDGEVRLSGLKEGDEGKVTQTEKGWKFSARKMEPGETAVIQFQVRAQASGNGKVLRDEVTVAGVPEKAGTAVYINSPKLDIKRTALPLSGSQVCCRMDVSQVNPGTFARHVYMESKITSENARFFEGSLDVIGAAGRSLTKGRDYSVTWLDEKHSAFRLDLLEANANMGYSEDPQIPVYQDERGRKAVFGGTGSWDYQDLNLQKKFTVVCVAALDDPSAAGQEITSKTLVSSAADTNGNPVKDDVNIPSGSAAAEDHTWLIGSTGTAAQPGTSAESAAPEKPAEPEAAGKPAVDDKLAAPDKSGAVGTAVTPEGKAEDKETPAEKQEEQGAEAEKEKQDTDADELDPQPLEESVTITASDIVKQPMIAKKTMTASAGSAGKAASGNDSSVGGKSGNLANSGTRVRVQTGDDRNKPAALVILAGLIVLAAAAAHRLYRNEHMDNSGK